MSWNKLHSFHLITYMELDNVVTRPLIKGMMRKAQVELPFFVFVMLWPLTHPFRLWRTCKYRTGFFVYIIGAMLAVSLAAYWDALSIPLTVKCNLE